LPTQTEPSMPISCGFIFYPCWYTLDLPRWKNLHCSWQPWKTFGGARWLSSPERAKSRACDENKSIYIYIILFLFFPSPEESAARALCSPWKIKYHITCCIFDFRVKNTSAPTIITSFGGPFGLCVMTVREDVLTTLLAARVRDVTLRWQTTKWRSKTFIVNTVDRPSQRKRREILIKERLFIETVFIRMHDVTLWIRATIFLPSPSLWPVEQ
jgi:hypothetical protein